MAGCTSKQSYTLGPSKWALKRALNPLCVLILFLNTDSQHFFFPLEQRPQGKTSFGLKTQKMWKYFYLQASPGSFIYASSPPHPPPHPTPSNWSSRACSYSGSLFTIEVQKRLVDDVLDTCSVHANLVHDVTDTKSARKKMAALAAVFWLLSNVDF